MTDEDVHALISAYLIDANAENATGTHRGAVLVWASIIDDVLLRMLKAHFVELNAEQRNGLFGPMGPLGGFSSRTKMLHALGIIKRDEMEVIDIVRGVRNKFAHSLGVSLNDATLSDISSDLAVRLQGGTPMGEPRHQFTGACSTLLCLLVQRLRKIAPSPGVPDDRPLVDRAW
jgi:DNA-binding MltR family transcriptional regulator